MAKNQEKKFGLAFDSGLKLICDAPGKKSPIHFLVTTQHLGLREVAGKFVQICASCDDLRENPVSNVTMV